jgi:hypothetical protein
MHFYFFFSSMNKILVYLVPSKCNQFLPLSLSEWQSWYPHRLKCQTSPKRPLWLHFTHSSLSCSSNPTASSNYTFSKVAMSLENLLCIKSHVKYSPAYLQLDPLALLHQPIVPHSKIPEIAVLLPAAHVCY